jgi:hypothetical protein
MPSLPLFLFALLSATPLYPTPLNSYMYLDITNEWFATNLLMIDYEKTNFLQFQTKNSKMLDIQVSYSNIQISNNSNYHFWD